MNCITVIGVYSLGKQTNGINVFCLIDPLLVHLDAALFMQMYLMIVSYSVLVLWSMFLKSKYLALSTFSLVVITFSVKSVSLTRKRYGWLAHILHKEGNRTCEGEMIFFFKCTIC